MKIDFFVMENATRLPALRELCSEMEKCYRNNESVYLHVNSKEEAEFMDKLLWTFRDESFVPHSLDSQSEVPLRPEEARSAVSKDIQSNQPSFETALRASSGRTGASSELMDDVPIKIGYEVPANAHTLINLTTSVPAFYQQYQRVIEVVYQDTNVQQAARERFRAYREAGNELTTHKMKVSFA